jgi:hypothetical protein
MSNWKQDRIVNGGLVTEPGDVWEIINHAYEGFSCISDSLLVRVVNADREYDSTASVPNRKRVWEILKEVSEIAARRVDYVTYLDGVEIERIPYKESEPYKYRFVK